MKRLFLILLLAGCGGLQVVNPQTRTDAQWQILRQPVPPPPAPPPP